MEENQSGSFRSKRFNFAPVSNSALKDPRLSLKSKGLYALIQSYITIPNFELKKAWLKGICREGEKAFDAAWKELKDCGYLKQYRIPNGKNDTFRYEYELLDEADETRPALITLKKHGEPATEKRTENDEIPHTPQNGGSAKAEPPDKKASTPAPLEKTEDYEMWHIPQNGGYANSFSGPHTPRFAPYANGTLCVSHPMPNGGDINNTDDSNTHDSNTYKSVSQSFPAADATDRQMSTFREKLKEQIDYDYFAETASEDLSGIDSLLDCLVDMEFAPSTKINGTVQSRASLHRYIEKADSTVIQEFLDHMRGKPMRNVKNISAYWRSSFLNFLRERELTLLTV